MCDGSRGAIHGASRAVIANKTTRIRPTVASGLWRASRGNEIEFADKVLSACSTDSRDHCRILGFTTEYSRSVIKFTATYVKPIARMHPCTR